MKVLRTTAVAAAVVVLLGPACSRGKNPEQTTSASAPALSFRVQIESCLGVPIAGSVFAGDELGHFLTYNGGTTVSTYGFLQPPHGVFYMEAHWPWPSSAGLRPPGVPDLEMSWGPFDEYDLSNMPVLTGPDGPPYCGAAD